MQLLVVNLLLCRTLSNFSEGQWARNLSLQNTYSFLDHVCFPVH